MKSIPFTFIWEPTSPGSKIDTAHNFQLKLSTSFTLKASSLIFFTSCTQRNPNAIMMCWSFCVNTARAPVSLYWVSGYLLLSKYVIYQILRPPFWIWKRCERVNTFGKINEDVTLTLEIFLAISAKWAKVALKNATKMRWKSLAV